MKKKRNVGKLRLVAAISMAMFTAFTFCCVSLAWFYSIRTTNLDGTGFISTELSGIVESVEFHEMITGTDSSIEYKYNETAKLAFNIDSTKDSGIDYTEGDSTTTVDIGTYSTYGAKRSLLVLFNLRQDGSDSDYNFTLKATTTMEDFSKTILGADGTIDQNNNSISDVIQFYAVALSEVKYDFSDDDTKTDITSNSKKFVKIENNVASLDSTSLSLIENKSKTKAIAVILSYNTDALELIYTKYIGSTVLGNENIYFKTIDFKLSV